MKMLRIIMILLGALLLTNCSGDFEQETGIVPSHSGQVSFLFGLQQDDASVVQTRGSKPARKKMRLLKNPKNCPMTG